LFCDKINASGAISIKVQALNLQKHYKNILEITTYRILTEMVNNTLKHAGATEISISLVQKSSKLFVHYTDNGIGFDYERMLQSPDKGMGLDNTISRINSVGGSCRIQSSKGNGFSADIELNV
jgi:signal transduction histidine kinase